MTPSNYVPIKECFTCLQDFLTYVDFGFSDGSAGFLSGLYHVTENKELFPELAREFLRGRSMPRIEP